MKLRALLACILLCTAAGTTVRAQDSDEDKIRQVLADQAAAWCRGDLEGFMEGYAKTAELRFASGDNVTRGWQETLARYKERYAERAEMGALTFADLEVTPLAPDAALVFGRWRLHTARGEPHGLFTLLFRKTVAGWRIVADHTSAAEP